MKDRHFIKWVVIAAALCGIEASAAVVPGITGTLEVPEHSLVRLKADGVDAKAAMIWRVSPKEGVSKATNPRGVLEFTGPPGTYDVDLLVITSDANGLDVAEAHVRVTIGKATPKPQPPPQSKADPAAATGRIQFGNAGCTATVMWPRRPDGKWDVLTAAHCTAAGIGSKGRMSLKDGRVIGVTVVTRDTTSDICWLVTDESIDTIAYAELLDEVAAVGTRVWHNGYGVDRPGNREDGIVIGATADNQLRMTLNVSSGDSGGGIFRESDGKLVACVCCTTNKGANVTMYGGHSISAAKLRPKGAASDDFNFMPQDLPQCEHGR